MTTHRSKLLAFSLILAGACGASSPRAAAPQATPQAAAPDPAPAQAAAHPQGLQIKLTTIYVDDQDKALHFYTDVLGFAKKDDVTKGPYRWLTVTAPGDPDGTALQLALDNNPAAKAYQQALFQQHQPAIMLFSNDLQGDYERIKARGGEFTMPPTSVYGATIAQLNDGCGNLVQLSQLAHP